MSHIYNKWLKSDSPKFASREKSPKPLGSMLIHARLSLYRATTKKKMNRLWLAVFEKPKRKQLLRPMTTGTNNAMNQSLFLAIICNSLKAREKLRVRAIGFGFASRWLKNWRESFKPITESSNSNHVITFDSHLKTALTHCFEFIIPQTLG